MLNKSHGSGMYNWKNGTVPSNQMTIMPVGPSKLLPKISRQPLKFNY
jgi:hypothetical protein